MKNTWAININKFTPVGYINDQLYEVAFVKSEIEHEELNSVECFSVICKIQIARAVL